MPVRIKICGITRYEDALIAANLGVDALGFIFYRHSKRYIAPERARDIICKIPPFVTAVGVFVDPSEDELRATMATSGIAAVQLHGSESPQLCASLAVPVIKAFSVSPHFAPTDIEPYTCSGILLDTWSETLKGGTGATFDWRIAAAIASRHKGMILAGGLGPSNLLDALESVRPYGVDLNSGVEVSPGVKNPRKLHDAVALVRSFV